MSWTLELHADPHILELAFTGEITAEALQKSTRETIQQQENAPTATTDACYL